MRHPDELIETLLLRGMANNCHICLVTCNALVHLLVTGVIQCADLLEKQP
jgi:hypothetical protein